MFVGREKELQSLNNSFNKISFQFPVIYGRRRVGKSTLINEFCKDKKGIYFVALQSTAKENLEILSAQILTTLAPEAPKTPFPSLREAIDYVFECSKKERFIFAIDEYPYLAKSDRSISSVLQAAIDKYQAESRLFLILCGSSISFMENQVLGHRSPLYGRRTAQYKLLPFDYYVSSSMLPTFSSEDKILLYSVTGGIPEYLSRIDTELTAKENIRDLFFDTSGRLFEEPENLLKQELRIPETYNAIISAIADGRSRLNEIATKAGIETSQCSKMLSTLMGLGLVRKEHPVTLRNSKKSIYVLNDWMFVFWYRFVKPELSRITAGLGETVCDDIFVEQINSHVGHAFEDCAVQYMWRLLVCNRSPIPFKTIGRWWGSNPVERREEEIDFVAFSGDKAAFGECKWRNTMVGEDILNDLKCKSDLLPMFSEKQYMLFSKAGFTNVLMSRSQEDPSIHLIDPNGMFG